MNQHNFTDEERLELQLPGASGVAFLNAYEQARSCGLVVVEADGDHLIELSPEGTRQILKSLPPGRTTLPGQVIEIL